MKTYIACGTWIHDNERKIIDYIESCDIFPNVFMICEATAIREKSVIHTLKMLRRQESLYIRRSMTWIEDTQQEHLHPTKKDMLILLLLSRYNEPLDIGVFMDDNRYYDEDGNVHFRFTEEEIKNALRFRKNKED